MAARSRDHWPAQITTLFAGDAPLVGQHRPDPCRRPTSIADDRHALAIVTPGHPGALGEGLP